LPKTGWAGIIRKQWTIRAVFLLLAVLESGSCLMGEVVRIFGGQQKCLPTETPKRKE
jgi:hypothetical protein